MKRADWFCLIVDKNKKINSYLIKENHYRYWFTIIFILVLLLLAFVSMIILAIFFNASDATMVHFTFFAINGFILFLSISLLGRTGWFYNKHLNHFFKLFYESMYFYQFNEEISPTFKRIDEFKYFKEKVIKESDLIKIKKNFLCKEKFITRVNFITSSFIVFNILIFLISFISLMIALIAFSRIFNW